MKKSIPRSKGEKSVVLADTLYLESNKLEPLSDDLRVLSMKATQDAENRESMKATQDAENSERHAMSQNV